MSLLCETAHAEQTMALFGWEKKRPSNLSENQKNASRAGRAV